LVGATDAFKRHPWVALWVCLGYDCERTRLDIFMAHAPHPNATASEELANPGGVSREQVLRRLRDWRDRVHRLYDDIERQLQGSVWHSDRKGKHTSNEELPQIVGVSDAEQPEIDILRIVRPDTSTAAVFYPRGLWIIGANGRIDLRITPVVGSAETYMLIDQSEPFAGPAHWIRMPIGAPFEREPFDPRWLLSKLH
jgi:hypothetical protein